MQVVLIHRDCLARGRWRRIDQNVDMGTVMPRFHRSHAVHTAIPSIAPAGIACASWFTTMVTGLLTTSPAFGCKMPGVWAAAGRARKVQITPLTSLIVLPLHKAGRHKWFSFLQKRTPSLIHAKCRQFQAAFR
jgi:hypothetical protein